MSNNIFNELERQLKNPYLTREDKVRLIEEAGNKYRASVDEDLKKYIRQQQIGGAIEIASAVPFGAAGAAKLGVAKLTPIAARKVLGNKVATGITQSAIGSAIDGAVYGYGRSLVENKNPLKTIAEDATFGGVVGGALGLPLGKAANTARAQDVKGINQLRRKDGADWGIPWRKAIGNPEKAIETLMEYQRGFVPNVFDKPGIGNFDLPWGTEKYGLAHALERRAGQKNLNINEFANSIPKTIREGIVTPGTAQHLNTSNIEDLKNKLSIANRVESGNVDRKWAISVHPQNKSARKRLADSTPVPSITSENGSIPHSISELFAKNNINNFLYKSNPAGWVNSEASTAARSAGNLMKNGGTYKVQPYRYEAKVEYTQEVPAEKIFTPDEIGKMSQQEFNDHEHAIRNQLQRGLINPDTKDFSGFKNPLTGSNKIHTREDIEKMSINEYSQSEPEINAQWGSVGIPSENEMKSNSGAIYVQGYKRADGTEVRGYYRSR